MLQGEPSPGPGPGPLLQLTEVAPELPWTSLYPSQDLDSPQPMRSLCKHSWVSSGWGCRLRLCQKGGAGLRPRRGTSRKQLLCSHRHLRGDELDATSWREGKAVSAFWILSGHQGCDRQLVTSKLTRLEIRQLCGPPASACSPSTGQGVAGPLLFGDQTPTLWGQRAQLQLASRSFRKSKYLCTMRNAAMRQTEYVNLRGLGAKGESSALFPP